MIFVACMGMGQNVLSFWRNGLKTSFDINFLSSFAIYSELHTPSWAVVTKATDSASLCAHLQPLQLEMSKSLLFASS